MKYKTLKELAKAYRNGELNYETPLTIDNDSQFVYVGKECVFRRDSSVDYDLIFEALDLLGIPAKNI